LVTKDEIFTRIWPDIAIEDSNLNQTVYKLRMCLQGAEDTEYIETVQKRGYRFIAPVQPVVPPQADPGTNSKALDSQVGVRSYRNAFVGAAGLLLLAGLAFLFALQRRGPKVPDAYLRGLQLERAGRDAEALEQYEMAIRNGSNTDKARVRAGW